MNLDHVIHRPFPPVEQAWDARDTALYALSLGMGSDPTDALELPYVYEGRDGRGLRAVPTFAMTLAWPPFWQDDPATGIDWVRILHGEQHVQWHRPLPVVGRVIGRHRLIAVEDKGPGRGAVIHFGITLEEAGSGAVLADIRQVQFLRGDGGCGAWGDAPLPCDPIPVDAVPDETLDIATLPQNALLYRLASRDYMPIHADPATAREAGFERPISHGLNTMGLVARAILRLHAPGAPERMRALSVRFVSPGLPGDTVRVEFFHGHDGLRLRARALERDVLLIDRVRCSLD
jgi:acyl dehydratase